MDVNRDTDVNRDSARFLDRRGVMQFKKTEKGTVVHTPGTSRNDTNSVTFGQ